MTHIGFFVHQPSSQWQWWHYYYIVRCSCADFFGFFLIVFLFKLLLEFRLLGLLSSELFLSTVCATQFIINYCKMIFFKKGHSNCYLCRSVVIWIFNMERIFFAASGLQSHVSHNREESSNISCNTQFNGWKICSLIEWWDERWKRIVQGKKKQGKKADNNNDALHVFRPKWYDKHMDDLVNYCGTDQKKRNIVHKGKYYLTLYFIRHKIYIKFYLLQKLCFHIGEALHGWIWMMTV